MPTVRPQPPDKMSIIGEAVQEELNRIVRMEVEKAVKDVTEKLNTLIPEMVGRIAVRLYQLPKAETLGNTFAFSINLEGGSHVG